MTVHAARLDRALPRHLAGRVAAARVWSDAQPAVLAVVAVAALAAASGGYFPTTWGWATIGFAWSASLALVLRDAIRLGPLELAALAGLAGLALWTLASTLWAPAAAPALHELQRTLLYAVGLLAALTVVRASSYRALAGGVWLGVTLVACYAVLTRMFPDGVALAHTVANNRLSAPVGYWNALGILVAIGAVLAVGLVAHARSGVVRACAGASLIPLTLTLYFTFSRGAWIALAIGLVAAVALEPRRLRLVAALAAAVPFPALAVAAASRSEALTSLTADAALAAAEGRRLFDLAVAFAAAAAGSALAFGAAGRVVRPGPGARRALGSLLLAAVAVSIVAVVVRAGGPAPLARSAWESFNGPPVRVETSLNERLFTFSGNWRAELWRVGLAHYSGHPLLGAGAGSYERAWLEKRPAPSQIRDAHSLYVETLAELGPVGLALLAAALCAPLAAAIRARRRALVPAAAGAYAAFLVHAAVDWDWEIPAVTAAALFAAAACLAAARAGGPAQRLSPYARGALAVALAAIAAFALVALVGNRAATASAEAASAERYEEAADQARRAARWAPWSARPWRLLGEAQLLDGEVAAARESFRAALARDDGDWELWLLLAFAGEDPAQRRPAAERALALNPLSPQIASVRPALGLDEERP